MIKLQTYFERKIVLNCLHTLIIQHFYRFISLPLPWRRRRPVTFRRWTESQHLGCPPCLPCACGSTPCRRSSGPIRWKYHLVSWSPSVLILRWRRTGTRIGRGTRVGSPCCCTGRRKPEWKLWEFSLGIFYLII